MERQTTQKEVKRVCKKDKLYLSSRIFNILFILGPFGKNFKISYKAQTDAEMVDIKQRVSHLMYM